MTSLRTAAADAAFERAAAVIPTGATSAARLGVRPAPLMIERSAGCRLVDLDGRRLIDFGLANGPLLLGHDPPEVVDAVIAQMRRGLMFGAQHALEATVAELLVELVPCAERVLLSTTGSEAVHAALRVARAATGRRTIVRFTGHYHGWLDDIAYAGPGSPPAEGRPDAGAALTPLTTGMRPARDVVAVPWNDVEALQGCLAHHADDVAAVILEPVPLAGLLLPEDGFLRAVRDAAHRVGALLIFDEVVTGFRLGRGGAQERFGVTPDLTVLGKAVAAGFPVSAVVGRADVLDVVSTGRMAHMGTFNGHPPSLAAAAAALSVYRAPELHAELEARTTRLADGLRRAASDEPGFRVAHVGALAATAVLDEDVTPRSYEDLAGADRERHGELMAALLAAGVFVPPRGTWMLSRAHTDDDVDEALDLAAATFGAR